MKPYRPPTPNRTRDQTILARRINGERASTLAREYGVSTKRIWMICNTERMYATVQYAPDMLEAYDLSMRILNALHRMDIYTVEALKALAPHELKRIPNLGPVSLQTLRDKGLVS